MRALFGRDCPAQSEPRKQVWGNAVRPDILKPPRKRGVRCPIAFGPLELGQVHKSTSFTHRPVFIVLLRTNFLGLLEDSEVWLRQDSRKSRMDACHPD